MRRPSDLMADGPRGRTRTPRSWPEGFARSPADRRALLVLLGLASLTPRRLLDLSARHPTAASCLRAVLDGEAGSQADRSLGASADPAAVTRRLDAAGARLVAIGDLEYPPELLDLFDPPAGLFVMGSLQGSARSRVAVVGARNCSLEGGDMATALGRGLAGAGVCVVSGGARGIDSAAHRGALEGGGQTIAVLGSGIDIPYPKRNRGLLAEVARAGALVTEYPPGTPPEPFRFPARNRIVAGLARAVVVVEGAAGSGSMISADHALDLGREVFAVPGPPMSELASVPLGLIRDGATLIRGAEDLLADLGIHLDSVAGTHGEAQMAPRGANETEREVWGALTASSTPDRLAAVTGLPLPGVISALVGLELRGYVAQAGGRYQRRLDSRSSG